MSTRIPARPGRRALPLAPLLALALAGCHQNGTNPPPAPAPDRLDALVLGPVQSAYLETLGPNLSMVQHDGSQKLEDFDLVIFDGDHHTPAAVTANPLVDQALRAGKLVLGVDLTEEHKQSLGGRLHASTCGPSAAYAIHTGYDANGRFLARVIEPSRSEAQPRRSGPPNARTDTPQPAPEPVRPAGQSCEAGANATAQNLRADPGATSAFAKTLLGEIAQPSRLARQDLPAGIPTNLIYATYYFTETFSTPLSGSLKGYGGTQTPNYTVNRTFTVYLNNKNNPQGDFQYVLLEQDAAANPKLSNENFIAMGTKWDSDWVIGSYDEAGWSQNRMQLSLWANPSDWDLVSTSPDTVNGSTNVTTGVSFQVGLSGNAAQGPGGAASFTYSNSQTRNITDWAADNLATNTETQWMYRSQYPVDARYLPNCTAAIRVPIACYLGQLPNALAQGALKLYTQSVWKTPSVINGPAGFSYWTWYEMLDVGCVQNGGAICVSADGLYQYQDYQPKYTQGVSFDLGVVVPIPIASITFAPNPVQGGSAVTGTVTLSSPAKIDTPIVLASNSPNATVLPSVTVKQGQTSATFQVLTNTNGIATGGSTVATVQAYYAQSYQAQLTIRNLDNASLTLAPNTVEPGQPSVGTYGLPGPVATDTVVPLTSSSPTVTVPPSVTVRAGQSSATFPIATSAPNLAYGASTVATITAVDVQAQLTITRVGLASLTFTPTTLVLGQPATGTVTRATPAPVDTVVPLSSGNVRAAVPPTVTIPKGQTSASFPVSSSALGPDSRGLAAITAADLQARLPLQGFTGVSASYDAACALKASGSVVCWGNSASGTPPAGLSGVTQLSTNEFARCALKGGGDVACWGFAPSSPLPSLLHGPFTQVSVAVPVCTLGPDGGIKCWVNGDSPVSPPASLTGAVQVSAGSGFACALKNDGTVACWPQPAVAPPSAASPPAGLSGALQVSAGDNHACALRNDGTVTCWGDNSEGQINVPAGLSGAVEVEAGHEFTCALKSGGTVACWGRHASGEATPPAGLSGVVQVSAGFEGACAVKNDGTVACWGRSGFTPPAGLNLLQP